MKTLVLGLGKTGLSCARYFTQKNIPFKINDTRENPPGLVTFKKQYSHIEYHCGNFQKDWIDTADCIVLSPGISIHEPVVAEAIKHGKKIIGDIELFATGTKRPIIAITGSNGKSTVTTLVGKMIADAGFTVGVGGNLGEPALNLLTDPEPDFYVLEISSFQLQSTFSLHAAAAVVLNISPDHLDQHRSFEEYLKAKQKIYDHCAHAIVNEDEPQIWSSLKLGESISAFTLHDAKQPAASQFHLMQINNQEFLAHNQQSLIVASELPLNHPHHLQNALAALALGDAIALPMEKMLQTLKTFTGLPHRCQLVATIDGVDYYNDSKATNIGACAAAIKSLAKNKKGRIILIAGGQGKGQDFSELRKVISDNVKQVLLMGEDAKMISDALKLPDKIEFVADMKAAVDAAREKAEARDLVLLSPACASFDMFDNFEHRGSVFAKLILQQK